jgi:hypothetical protein
LEELGLDKESETDSDIEEEPEDEGREIEGLSSEMKLKLLNNKKARRRLRKKLQKEIDEDR